MSNLLTFVVLIGTLITVHEMGQLLAAKLAGVKVARVSLGFGPALLWFRLGDVPCCVAPIPLGCYVTLLGKSPGEPLPTSDAARAFSARPPWARVLVLLAGPFANLVFPFFLYVLCHLVLAPSNVPPAVLGTIVEGSAADRAGLRQGDRIVAIDGRSVHSWRDMVEQAQGVFDRELLLQVEREGERLDVTVTPDEDVLRDALGESKSVGRLGVLRRLRAPQIGIVDERSSAYVAGLRTGDVITSIDGKRVRTIEELRPALADLGDGAVPLTYLRAVPVPGPLGTSLFYESAEARLLPHVDGDGRPSTGLLPGSTFIRSVDPYSPAEGAGLRPGDRIIEVDGTAFTQWETLAKVLNQRQQQPVMLLVESPGERPRLVEIRQRSYRVLDIYHQERELLWFGAQPYEKWTLVPNEPARGRMTRGLTSALDEMGAVFSILADGSSFWMNPFHTTGTAEERLYVFALLMAIASIQIVFISLLPIPRLDGWYLLLLLVEATLRRPLEPRERRGVGFVLILTLLLGWMMLR